MIRDSSFWAFAVSVGVFAAIFDAIFQRFTGMAFPILTPVCLVIFGMLMEYDTERVAAWLGWLPWVKSKELDKKLAALRAEKLESEIVANKRDQETSAWNLICQDGAQEKMISICKALHGFGGIRIAEAHHIIGKLCLTFRDPGALDAGIVVRLAPPDDSDFKKQMRAVDVTAKKMVD